MSVPAQNAQTLMEKIQSLPAERIAEVEDFVDFLRERATCRKETATDKESLDFPVISVGKWPEDLSLRREDMYGDDGR